MLRFIRDQYDTADKLLILRGIAAVAVVIFHVCLPLRRDLIIAGVDLSLLLHWDGILAVYFFFVLSAYLIAKVFALGKYSLTMSGITRFFRSRMIRIFPLYYGITTVLVVFVYPHLLRPDNWSGLIRILLFQFDQSIHQSFSFNIAYWAISTEVQFYLIAPLIAWGALQWITTTKRSWIAFGISITWAFLHRIWLADNTWWYQFLASDLPFIQLIRDIDVFLIGFMGSWLVSRSQSVQKFLYEARYHVIGMFLIIFVISAYNVMYNRELLGLYQPIVYTGFALILIWLIDGGVYHQKYQRQEFTWRRDWMNLAKWLELLGLLSYGIYLWHLPVYQTVTPILSLGATRAMIVELTQFVTFLIVVGLSYATYWIVEKRFIR